MGMLLLVIALVLQNIEPKIIEKVDPVYPAVARTARLEGSVHLSVKITPDGRVENATVITGIPQFNDAAIQAVRHWKFAPSPTGGVAEITIPFALPPLPFISGRVVDAEGRPVPRASVRTRQMSYRGERRSWNSAPVGAVTDDSGKYRISVPEPGEYYVIVSAPPTDSYNDYSPHTYHPGTPDGLSAVPVAVRPGPDAVADIRIPRMQTVTISGKVVLPPSINGTEGTLQILLARLDPAFVAEQVQGRSIPRVTGTEVSFEFRRVRPGTYHIAASLREGPPVRVVATHSGGLSLDTRDQNLEGVTLTIHRNVELKGRIVLQDPAIRLESLRVSLVSQEGISGGGGSNVAADGTFVIPISQGSYYVRLTPPPATAYVSDLRYGPLSVYPDGAVTITDRPPDELQIILSANGASIEGKVQGRLQQGVAAHVMLVPDLSRRQNPLFYGSVKSDVSGAFRFTALPPGDYKLFAFETPPPEGAMENAQFIAQYELRGVRVTVREGTAMSGILAPLIQVSN